MRFLDSHCHLDDEQFDPDREAVLARAREAAVALMMTIGTGSGPADLEVALRLARQHPDLYATVGVHPHHAAEWREDTLDRLRAGLNDSRVLALGEIGLDYHYDFSPRDQQETVFVAQMQLAAESGKPIIIHTREAWEDTFRLLDEHWRPTGLPCVLHCFTGGPAEAEHALAQGYLLSFAGMVTYPKAVEIQQAAQLVPRDRLLFETDAPYLAPVPKRGKRNEPSFVVRTAERLAELRGEPLSALTETVWDNFHRVFRPASSRGVG